MVPLGQLSRRYESKLAQRFILALVLSRPAFK